MSTVTLSQPHCAMTSAEKPLGIASQPLTQALPACSRFFSMFVDIFAFPFLRLSWSARIISPLECRSICEREADDAFVTARGKACCRTRAVVWRIDRSLCGRGTGGRDRSDAAGDNAGDRFGPRQPGLGLSAG